MVRELETGAQPRAVGLEKQVSLWKAVGLWSGYDLRVCLEDFCVRGLTSNVVLRGGRICEGNLAGSLILWGVVLGRN